MKYTKRLFLPALLLAILLAFTGCIEELEQITDLFSDPLSESSATQSEVSVEDAGTLTEIPPYKGSPYVTIEGNVPNFTEEELTPVAYESYAPLDALGRCGIVIASLGLETMPAKDEERGSISSVYPSGWIQAKYDNIPQKYLYNRCHLIGWQLSAENANKSNLITGTRYFNVDGMLPFENMVADYIKETGNHVAYRVTPLFEGNDLLCRGVQMEAYSVEDEGDGVCFNVFIYNVQPGITINYSTGASVKDGE